MKNTKLVLGIMLIMLLAMSTSLMAGTYSGGNGSSVNPYQIANLTDLGELSTTSADWVTGIYFIQTADIDASATSGWNGGAGFSPIGNTTTKFSGNYDGQNHTIDGLFINLTISEVGLFGWANNDANIQNLGTTNVNITANGFVGGLVGDLDNSNMTNCYSTGSVTSTGLRCGGLIGNNYYGTVDNCYSSCTVTGTGDIGGLIGDHWSGVSESDCTLINSYSTGAVISTGMNTGGLVGYAYYATITNCYSLGNVIGTSTLGGLLGHLWSYVTISSSYSLGNVSGTDVMGGLVGHVGAGTISNCYSMGNVTRTSGTTEWNIGAFAGYVMGPATIENSYCTSSVYYTGTDDPTDKGFCGGVWQITAPNNFWDRELSNQTTATGATAKTTAEMKTLSTFTDAGWDFRGETANGTDDIWNIGNGRNDGYPYFDWQFPGDDDPPTPVELSTFTAVYTNGSSLLEWTTQSESNNLGWNIYRSETELDDAVQINGSLIQGAGTTTEPTEYEFADEQDLILNTTYNYWLESISFSGETEHFGPISLTIPEEGENPDDPEMEEFGLFHNFPNPTSNITSINYNLKEAADCELNIYNLKGQLIRTFKKDNTKKGEFIWKGTDSNNNAVSSGIYFYKLKAGNEKFIKKLILMK